MQPGKHNVKLVNYGGLKTKNGDWCIGVTLENDQGEQITQMLSCKGGALAITYDNLKYLGLASEKDFVKLNLGLKGGALDTDKTYIITVVNEEYEGKVNPKIKYFGEGGLSYLDENEAINLFNSTDIMGRLLQLKQQKPNVTTSPQVNAINSEIPF